MRLLRRIFLTLLFLAIAGAIWAGIYAQRRGFSKTWREMVEAEFSNRGYYVDIGRLTLGPFQGLVAEDVRFFNDPQRRRELAFVDNVILDLDLTDVLNRDLAINTLDVKDAKLTLPITPGRRDSELLKIDGFNARVVVTENQIEVVRAQARLAGVDVSVKGTLFRPPRQVSPKEGEATEAELAEQKRRLNEIRRRLDVVQQVVKSIEELSFSPQEPPQLEVTFSGDLADLAHLNASARVSASHFHRGAYPVEQLSISAEFDGSRQRALLKELHLKDEVGDLRLQADWPLEKRSIDFTLESNADLPSLIASLWANPKLGEVVFFSPPRLEMEGSINPDALRRYPPTQEEGADWLDLPLQATGRIRSERFGSRGAVFDGMEAEFALQGKRTYVRGLRLDHKSGVLFAHFMYDPDRVTDRFRYQTEVKLDPRIFAPFLTTEASKRFLSAWMIGQESSVYLAGIGAGPSLEPATWSSTGVVDLRRFRLNNVPFDRLEAEYEGRVGTHTFRNLSVERPEGSLTAVELRHLAEPRVWEANQVRSHLDPKDLIQAVAPGWASQSDRLQFSHPPEATLTGRIDASGSGERDDFEIVFRSEQTARFDFLGRPLPLSRPSGTLRAKDGRWQVTNFESELFGGKVSATFDAESLKTGSHYDTSLEVDRLAFDELLHLYGNTEQSGGGAWSGLMKFAGKLGEPLSVVGTGQAELRGGDLTAVPLLAPAF
ncbi:MAG: hypothetical protein KDM64_00830, partial [Verrucomicrobiae bacterium]|nr:hypothetical protein [Verrucomicrobiae bacterium]